MNKLWWPRSLAILLSMYFLLLCLAPSNLDVAKIAIGALCLAGAWSGFLDKKFFIDPVLLTILAFAGIAMLGNILAAGNIPDALKILTWSLPFLLGKAFSKTCPECVMSALVWSSCLLGVYMAIALLFLTIQPVFAFAPLITDLTLTFRNLSRTGLFLAVGSLISVHALTSLRGPFIRTIAGSSATILFLALIVAGRRMTAAAFLATSVLFLLFRKQYRLVAVLFIITASSIIFLGQSQRFDLSPSRLFADQSLVDRQKVWFAGWKLFSADPLLGSGFGTFKELSQPYVKEYHDAISCKTSLESLEDAHNIIIHFAAETGILGVGAILFLFWAPCRHGWRLRNDHPAALSLCLCISMAFLHFQMHAHLKSTNVSGLIFLLMGMAMGLPPQSKQSSQ